MEGSGTEITLEMQEVAQRHFQLVQELKKALSLSNAGFLRAGEILFEIKTNKTYRGEDAQNRWTWKMFCSRDDVQVPGVTGEARRRVADALIRVHDTFILTHSIDPQELLSIGWTKLDMISRKCQYETEREKVLEWIAKAKTLSSGDLMAELKHGSQSLEELMACTHANEFVEWRCPDCGEVRRTPMCTDHQEWKAVIRTKKPIPKWALDQANANENESSEDPEAGGSDNPEIGSGGEQGTEVPRPDDGFKAI